MKTLIAALVSVSALSASAAYAAPRAWAFAFTGQRGAFVARSGSTLLDAQSNALSACNGLDHNDCVVVVSTDAPNSCISIAFDKDTGIYGAARWDSTDLGFARDQSQTYARKFCADANHDNYAGCPIKGTTCNAE